MADKMEQRAYDGEEGKTYKLVLRPSTPAMYTILHLEKGNQIASNNNFEAYEVTGMIPVKGIVYIDSEPDEKSMAISKGENDWHFEQETYDDYIKRLEDLDDSNTEWIKQIVAGNAEREKVLHRNDEFLIVRDWKFDQTLGADGKIDVKNLHLLGIPTIKIHSIRNVKLKHIPMLQRIKAEGLRICSEIYGINERYVKTYFHYPPSTYYLHVHFAWIGLSDDGTNFDIAFDFDTVIENIKRDPTHYKQELRIIWV